MTKRLGSLLTAMMIFRKICTLIALLWANSLFGQTLIVTLNPIAQVPVGGAFTVSGAVSHDPATPTIPGGTPVNITIQVFDPSGNAILVAPAIPFTGGFAAGGVFNFNQSFTMPWSEDDKWTATANWSASVTASSSVSALVQGTQNFTLLIPDLTVLGNQPTNARPGEFIDLTGTIRNLANVQAEPGVFFKVEASIAGGTTKSIVFPPVNSWVAGTPWPISETSDNDFTIPNFFIPADTPAGPLDITLSVDDPNGNEIIHEQDDVANNSFTHTINITVGGANLLPSSEFLINGNKAGTFQGLDAVNCNVTIRNVGAGPVLAGDAFVYRVALSNDLTFSQDDFLLRQIDLGGGGLGLDLRPNETITLDWIQLLPDNFEGDFYVITDMNGAPLSAEATPSLTLRSENETTISSESAAAGAGHHHSRPSTTLDGMIIAHESLLPNGVNEILLVNKGSGQSTTITTPVGGGQPNGSSYAPVISSSGKFVVFHSHASNLVPNDTNGHVDVFRYEVFNGRLTRLSLGPNGEEGNGGSFYPAISDDGTRVVFESHATNLDLTQSTSGKQVFLWTESKDTASGTGTVSAISDGNADSFDASISGDGARIVFTTFADVLDKDTGTDTNGEKDTNKGSDVILWENGQFYFAGRGEDGSLPKDGETKEGVISSNGEMISFVSSGRNMVTGKGLAHILIEDVGVGYPAGSTVQIIDDNGSGAAVSVSSRNQYGEILGFSIDFPGKNYVNPTLSVTVPAGASQPTRDVNATPLLVNPDGDVFTISVAEVKSKGKSKRISESQPLDGDSGSETGGNLGSREPSISQDGKTVAYSTRASNLLDLNVPSTNTKTFANRTFRPATAQAVLHWEIGSIAISNPGTGYLGTGTLVIDDLSGGGSGAIATYHVLSNGEVGEITIINPGSGYDLNQTVVSIQNDPTGTGFMATAQGITPTGLGANRQGGAAIHRIEIIDPGTGYPPKLNQQLQPPEIIIDGDGSDLDSDGKTDARLNPDRLYSGTSGEIYIEQQIDLGINQRSSLDGSTLTISDVNRTLTLSFTSSPRPTPSGTLSLGVDFNDTLGNVPQTDFWLKKNIIQAIDDFWGIRTNLLDGPIIENNGSLDGNFTFRALNGSMETDNRSSLQISYRSNMLVGGNGYTRATPIITPAPAIIGFSEVQSGTSTITLPNGRPIFSFQEDIETDDVYLFDQARAQNHRVSVNKFGFPTNYLAGTTLPSHRYPAISGDARHVFFSSDASDLGGLIFGRSNQVPQDTALNRSIYSVDLKSNQLPKNNDDYSVTISSNILTATNATTYLSRPFPIMVKASAKKGSLTNVRLYADGMQVGNNNVGIQGTRDHETFFSWTPNRQGTFEIVASVVNNLGEEIFSTPTFLEVIAPTSTSATGNLTIRPAGAANQTTEGSSLLASVEFTGSNGKKAHVASVAFYLNDQLIETQTDPPFSTVFSPPAYDGNATLSRWSFSALALDLNGTAFVTSRFGQIQGSSVLPTLTLSPLSSLNDNEVFDKQRVTIEASVHGDSDALALVQTASFYGNGILLEGNVAGVPITTASGQTTSVEYQIDWDVDFSRFAKPDGMVEIVALGELAPVGGFVPVFASSGLPVRISPPTPWLDEKSTALSLFSDLSEANMSTRQVEALVATINSGSAGSLETWVDELSEVASFQQKLDVIAAHHISMGEWHESFLDLETDFTTWIPNGTTATPTWLKRYVDFVLNSDQYVAKFGVVPLLVGTRFEKDMYDFSLNRRRFAEQCLTNKYGIAPSFQQMFQGSKRMLHFWDSSSGNNYWELHPQPRQQGGGQGGPAVVVPVFSNPRVDDAAPTNYAAGECAVELVMQLAIEIPVDGLQYILYTEPIRDSLYKVATFAQLLWRENADPINDADIKRLAAMSSTEAIKAILNDYRYTSRFNLIWKESDVVDTSTPSWKKEDWFGYFWDKHFPWVYHENLGWIYIAGVSPTQFWFHHEKLGWLWTGAAHYPNVYSSNEQGWIYFSSDTKAYFSHTSNSWNSF